MSIELKPCPFCGKEPIYIAYGSDKHQIDCDNNEQCMAVVGTPTMHTKEDAYKVWNTRISITEGEREHGNAAKALSAGNCRSSQSAPSTHQPVDCSDADQKLRDRLILGNPDHEAIFKSGWDAALADSLGADAEVDRILAMSDEEIIADAGGKEAAKRIANDTKAIFNRAKAAQITLAAVSGHLDDAPLPVQTKQGVLQIVRGALGSYERLIKRESGELKRLCAEHEAMGNPRIPEESSWQPIETAPKDGTHIIAVYQRNPEDVRQIIEVWWKPKKHRIGDQMIVYEWESWDDSYADGNFVEWMPLPKPPEGK